MLVRLISIKPPPLELFHASFVCAAKVDMFISSEFQRLTQMSCIGNWIAVTKIFCQIIPQIFGSANIGEYIDADEAKCQLLIKEYL